MGQDNQFKKTPKTAGPRSHNPFIEVAVGKLQPTETSKQHRTNDIKVTEFFVKLNPIGTWYLRFISPTYNPSMHHSDSQQKKSSNDPPAGNTGRTAMDESNAILAQILRAESCTQTLAFLVTLVEFLCCRPECLWLDECDGFWCQTVSGQNLFQHFMDLHTFFNVVISES